MASFIEEYKKFYLSCAQLLLTEKSNKFQTNGLITKQFKLSKIL
jgi:hypothetical protein